METDEFGIVLFYVFFRERDMNERSTAWGASVR